MLLALVMGRLFRRLQKKRNEEKAPKGALKNINDACSYWEKRGVSQGQRPTRNQKDRRNSEYPVADINTNKKDRSPKQNLHAKFPSLNHSCFSLRVIQRTTQNTNAINIGTQSSFSRNSTVFRQIVKLSNEQVLRLGDTLSIIPLVVRLRIRTPSDFEERQGRLQGSPSDRDWNIHQIRPCPLFESWKPEVYMLVHMLNLIPEVQADACRLWETGSDHPFVILHSAVNDLLSPIRNFQLSDSDEWGQSERKRLYSELARGAVAQNHTHRISKFLHTSLFENRNMNLWAQFLYLKQWVGEIGKIPSEPESVFAIFVCWCDDSIETTVDGLLQHDLTDSFLKIRHEKQHPGENFDLTESLMKKAAGRVVTKLPGDLFVVFNEEREPRTTPFPIETLLDLQPLCSEELSNELFRLRNDPASAKEPHQSLGYYRLCAFIVSRITREDGKRVYCGCMGFYRNSEAWVLYRFEPTGLGVYAVASIADVLAIASNYSIQFAFYRSEDENGIFQSARADREMKFRSGLVCCDVCGVFGAKKRCSRCQVVYYCRVACQKRDWRGHRPICVPVNEQVRLEKEERAELIHRLQRRRRISSFSAFHALSDGAQQGREVDQRPTQVKKLRRQQASIQRRELLGEKRLHRRSKVGRKAQRRRNRSKKRRQRRKRLREEELLKRQEEKDRIHQAEAEQPGREEGIGQEEEQTKKDEELLPQRREEAPLQPHLQVGFDEQPSIHQENSLKDDLAPFEDDEVDVQEQEVREDVPDVLLCVICMDDRRAILFQPCGHLVCCRSCSGRVSDCPMCRKPITGRIVVAYL